MRKELCCTLCLICLLSLCACAPESAAIPSPSPVSIPGRAAGIVEEETLLTVDGRDIPAWEYL
ncbi:MAG: hypothetical protein IJR48_05025, partial [Oscillibacter sp.]|nr:hypothetical protein [Oscillibacter sp.]